MRPFAFFILVSVACCLPSHLLAQGDKKFSAPGIERIRVGFQSYQQTDPTAYKVGLWTPIHVTLFGGTEGLEAKANQSDDDKPHLVIETMDSEDVGTQIHLPVRVEPLQTLTVTGYVKTGHMGRVSNEIRVVLKANGYKYQPLEQDQYWTLNIDAHLYLTMGAKINDFHRAVRKIGLRGDEKEAEDFRFDSSVRHVAFETDVKRLPEYWFGYNSIDLAVLSTENRDFLTALRNDPAKLKALATWVRRGGRLIVPIAWARQAEVHSLLNDPLAWTPPIPVVPPKDAGNPQDMSLPRLAKVEDWAGIQGHPFQIINPKNPQKSPPIPIATLDPGRVAPGDWEILADGSDDRTRISRPLMTRVRYGLGQIVYLAFSLEDKSFIDWSGKEQFLQKLATRLAPQAPTDVLNKDMGGFGHNAIPNDLTTDLLVQLDDFDITVIPFGYVALFIVLYILVVGPLDFFLLKYVFKRLEWTWVTFPTVVLAVSVIAYFSAYALKGRDLKINKVDIVDFDLRTSRDPLKVRAYGQSFFTILSPRIQSYTIGVEPNPTFWGGKADKANPLSVDLMSWMGRPSGGPHEMRRSSSSGFFRNAYQFRDDASGLKKVPIPVWTTKAFSAAWEQPLARAPFKIDLVYHQKEVQGKELKITGTIENHLGVDLVDVWLIYDDRCYAISNGLKKVENATGPQTLTLAANPSHDVRSWVNLNPAEEAAPTRKGWSANPSGLVKKLLFHERFDTTSAVRNHLMRPLDLGWRIEEHRDPRDRRTREAILFARVPSVSGLAETMTREHALPTNLWIGEFPEPNRDRPELIGQLNQETFVRVLLPVRPAEE